MNDMTQGSILPKILKFSLFIFIGGLMQNLYLIIDSIILGQYVGKEALAAIGVAHPVNFVVLGFLIGITQGFSINMAQSFGAKDLSKLRKYIYNSVWLCIIIGLIFTIILSLTNVLILKSMNTPENLFDMTHDFLFVLYIGCISNLFYNLFANVLRSVGNSFAPLIFLGIAVISNAILVFLFVAIFNFGVVGSAVATIISQTISAVSCYFFISYKYPTLKLQKEDKKLSKKYFKRLLRQGIPMGLQFSFTGIGVIIVQSFLNNFSTEHIAGFSVANRIQNIIVYVFVALGAGISTFIGQNYGARKISRINKAMTQTAILTLFISVICSIIVINLGEPFAKLFTEEYNPDLIAASQTYFEAAYLAYPLLAMLIVYRNAIQGYGFPMTAMSAGIVELVMRIVIVVLFTSSYGYVAICYADSITWVVTGIFLIAAYYYLAKTRQKQNLIEI